jgi:DNA primase
MLGEVIPINELPANHKAVEYLTERGFDTNELGTVWDVGYVHSALDIFHKMQGRIFVPIFMMGGRVCWKGRYVGDDFKKHGAPKYFNLTGFRKSKTLYNYDHGIKRNHVVVEGVADVWAYGDGAVASFDKTIAPAQEELLSTWAKRKGLLVLILDPRPGRPRRRILRGLKPSTMPFCSG